MKRLWAKCAVAMCLLLVFVCVANAQLIKEIRFSAAEGYSDGLLEGQPAGADDVWTNGVADVSPDSFVVSNESLVITPEGVDRWVYIAFPIQSSGAITITWEWQYVGPEDSNVDIGFCIAEMDNFMLDGNSDLTWNEQSCMTRMQQEANVIDVRDGDWAGGGSYSAFEDYPYTDGKLIFMRYEIDVENQTYDVYAQKEGEDEVMLADDYGYRRETIEGLNSITLWDDGDAVTSSVIIDNIVIAGPAAVSDWQLF